MMDLVGAIYDTVLDRTIWPDVLKKLSLFVEGAASAVFWALTTRDESNQGRLISTTTEWAQPQGLVDFVSITLEKTARKAAMFGVFRHARNGVVDEGARQRVQLLAPHIRRAVLISKVVDFKRDEAEMLARTLDGLRAAVILVDARGRIVHANAAAGALLSDGCVIQPANGALTA